MKQPPDQQFPTCDEIMFSSKPGDFTSRKCDRPAGYGVEGKKCHRHAQQAQSTYIPNPRGGKSKRAKIWH